MLQISRVLTLISPQIFVLFFARGRELAGCKSARLSVPAKITAAELFDHIVDKYPRYGFRMRSAHSQAAFTHNLWPYAACNRCVGALSCLCGLSTRIHLTILSSPLVTRLLSFPPSAAVEKMARFVEISDDPLSLDACVRFVGSSKAGAISTFIGTTRDTFEGTVCHYLI